MYLYVRRMDGQAVGAYVAAMTETDPETPKRPKSTKPRRPRRFSKAKAAELYAVLAAERPDPHTELNFVNPYTLVVAVALSAQATDVGVNKATRKLFRKVKTPEAMLELGEKGLKEHIRTIGLYNSKASNIMATCKKLHEEHGGKVPEQRNALEALAGVGRKTANVVLNTAFGQPTIAVDTHIFRVSNRTGIAAGKNVTEVEKRLLRLVPEAFKQDAHHWLILHGRYTCVARTPRCGSCLIEDLCEYRQKTDV